MSKPDWSTAAGLPPDELAHFLEEDHDDVDDNPEMTDVELAALTPGKRRPGQRGPARKPSKVMVALRVEPSTLEAWRASGAGWQTRIGELLAREAPKMKRSA